MSLITLWSWVRSPLGSSSGSDYFPVCLSLCLIRRLRVRVPPGVLALRKTTARGFEPLRAEPNGFLVHHHKDTETQRHRGTEEQRHRGTETDRQIDRQTNRQADKQAETLIAESGGSPHNGCSNLQMLVCLRSANTPGGTRTRNLRIRSLTPCPLGHPMGSNPLAVVK